MPPAIGALWSIVNLAIGRTAGWPEAAYGVIVGFALFVAAASLRSQGFVAAVVRGPAALPRVALTFDDGPDPETTPKVLAALAAAGAHATFFMLAEKARRHPELVARVVAAGHEIGCHGEAHRWHEIATPALARASLTRACAVLREAAGTDVHLYRPPFGVTTPALRGAVARLGLTVVGWSVRTLDTMGGDASACTQATLARTRAGDIVLLHDARERAGRRLPLGITIVGELCAGLARQGLSLVTISELLGGAAPAPRNAYTIASSSAEQSTAPRTAARG